MTVRRGLFLATAFLLVLLLGALARLARLERGGPAHEDLELAGGVPARLYVPTETPAWWGLPPPPPAEKRRPAVVLCHGFAGDRSMMSTLARRIASNGYPVLTIDARGHGENRNRFAGGRSDHLAEEFAAGVEFLRASPYVDGKRIAVMGHSMGAAAALDYATRHPGIEASGMISGGFRREGPLRPPNALFIYAERDPKWLRDASDALVQGLRAELAGRRADDFPSRTAVERIEVPGHDHVTILWSGAAAAEIVGWLDASFGTERAGPVNLAEPRLATVGAGFLAFVLLLPALGWGLGRLAPKATAAPSTGALLRLGAVALALAATLPLSSGNVVSAVLSQPVSQELASFYLWAGTALLAGMALLGRLDLSSLAARWPGSVIVAALGGLAIVGALTPMGVVLHRLTLTPERAVVTALTAMTMFPLFLALELLLRRGTVLAATLASAAGRTLVVLATLLGITSGLLPGFIAFLLPLGAVFFVLVELLAAPLYAVSRNRLVIALVQTGWLAWLQASGMAIRL
jgi:dienelactone hydrolase